MSIQYNTVQYHTPSIQYDMIQYSQHTIQHSTASYTEHTLRYDTVQPAYNTTQYSIIQRAYNTIRYSTASYSEHLRARLWLPQISQDFRSTALRYVHAGHAANTRSQSDRIRVSAGLPMVSAAPSSSSSASAATESFVSIPDEDGEECRTAHAAYVDRQRTVCNECRNE